MQEIKETTPVNLSARLDKVRTKRLLKIKKKWELEDKSDTIRKMIDYVYKSIFLNRGENNA